MLAKILKSNLPPDTKPLGTTQYLILTAVNQLSPLASAPTIQAEFKSSYGREITMGQIYATLDRAEASGLVSSAIVEPTPVRGGRRKRVFSLEEKGLRRLQVTKSLLTMQGAVTA